MTFHKVRFQCGFSIRPEILNFFLYALIVLFLLPAELCAEEKYLRGNLSQEWGGHLRLSGSVTWQADDTVYEPAGTGTHFDGSGEFRIKNSLFFGKKAVLESHYEAVLSGGHTRKKGREAERLVPGLPVSGIGSTDDTRRFLDMSSVIEEEESCVLHHRMDRLNLTLQADWGTVRIGRQALTWGNGMLFHPMDLFNPFAPTDVVRDYKIGDDMITAQFSAGAEAGFQMLYVPRRNPETGDAQWDSSALAGKYHFSRAGTEFDLMAGRNCRSYVFGLGSTGYMGEAAWRADAVWTFLPKESGKSGYLSLVANMDYSWVWQGKNMYGLAEFYYNGLGTGDYENAPADTDLTGALERGEIFTLGRLYLAGQVQMEIHPLLNFYIGLITNLTDPSAVCQPRLVWSLAQNADAIIGGNLYLGGSDTEYGGFRIPGTDFRAEPGHSACLHLTCYF
ncbi:MAG: hypothetical protein R2941_16405 [Desulfobacterales bacterium]